MIDDLLGEGLAKEGLDYRQGGRSRLGWKRPDEGLDLGALDLADFEFAEVRGDMAAIHRTVSNQRLMTDW